MKSTIHHSKQFTLDRVNMNEIDGYLQNRCLICGWSGSKHYNHNDYQHSNCQKERNSHAKHCNLKGN